MSYANVRLTGNTRYRTNLFGKLVLQVQEQGDFQCSNYDHPTMGGNPYHGTTETWWRDANSKDVVIKTALSKEIQ